MELFNNMLDNFVYLIWIIGHIPNGYQYYFVGWFQPLFFALIIQLLERTETFESVS